MELREKELGQIEGNSLKFLHLNLIDFEMCKWNAEFALLFCNSNVFHRSKLHFFSIKDPDFNNNLNSYLNIFNALSFCLNLKSIYSDINFRRIEASFLPKSFYNFLSHGFLLSTITFINFVFYDYMNFQHSKCCIFLKELEIVDCYFHLKIYKSFYLNNFQNLCKLNL